MNIDQKLARGKAKFEQTVGHRTNQIELPSRVASFHLKQLAIQAVHDELSPWGKARLFDFELYYCHANWHALDQRIGLGKRCS